MSVDGKIVPGELLSQLENCYVDHHVSQTLAECGRIHASLPERDVTHMVATFFNPRLQPRICLELCKEEWAKTCSHLLTAIRNGFSTSKEGFVRD